MMITDIIPDKEFILVFNDIGYEVELEYADDEVIRITCPDLEEEFNE